MANKEDEARSNAAALMGKKGGKARAKKLTPERRKEIAQKAIATRWKNARQKALAAKKAKASKKGTSTC